LRKVGRAEAPPPAGIAPVLKPLWQFARDMARRFNRELLADRTEEFLKNLAKRFT
jgi:hypothetical protein